MNALLEAGVAALAMKDDAVALYEKIRDLAKAKGMNPDEFDRQANAEIARVQKWRRDEFAKQNSDFPQGG